MTYHIFTKSQGLWPTNTARPWARGAHTLACCTAPATALPNELSRYAARRPSLRSLQGCHCLSLSLFAFINLALAPISNSFFLPSAFCFLVSGPHPQANKTLKVIIDILYQYAIMVSLGRQDSSPPSSHARPPGSPSNFFRILPSHTVTFSPTPRSLKSFSCNTYGFPRKCCKQKTYGRAKPFRYNTYKKQGGRILWLTSFLCLPTFQPAYN